MYQFLQTKFKDHAFHKAPELPQPGISLVVFSGSVVVLYLTYFLCTFKLVKQGEQ